MLWGVQISPPALFKETATLFEFLSLPYDHSSGIESPIPKQTKQKKKEDDGSTRGITV
jgi:hypothetical protein